MTQYGYPANTPLAYAEEDHLVPLELLGVPTSTANLWPQIRHKLDAKGALLVPGAEEKDLVENYLNNLVCKGQLALPAAQMQIASDWYSVWLRMGAPEGSRQTHS